MPTLAEPALRTTLAARYLAVRDATERLAAPLSPEDQQLQSMTSCSPTKWHRAHTTWFFETFLLAPRGIARFDERYPFLFNSYYEAAGPRHARPKRGMVSRPAAAEVGAYRRAVDGAMLELLDQADDSDLGEIAPLVELGLAHEQQHQELLLTDILNAFAENPLRPAYLQSTTVEQATVAASPEPLRFVEHAGGLVEIGSADEVPFCFDNERPRHRVWLEPFALSHRLVTVGEMKAFIDEGGYETASLWLSEGIDWVRTHGIRAPLYARYEGGVYETFGHLGTRHPTDDEPVGHLSFYEADAVASFLGGRLPTEAEWEAFAADAISESGNFVDDGHLRPLAAAGDGSAAQLFGDLWEWTRSAYEPYPGYAAGPGALGEYNGKFMVNQLVLRGGSFLTPRGHVRASYRNFWHPETRFQASGLRVARSL